MDLVERDAETALLGEKITDCLLGNGSIAVIRGAVASGKTALLLNAGEQATASGALFLTATASHLERTVELGVVHQLLRSHNGELPALGDERVSALLGGEAAAALARTRDSAVIAPAAARLFEDLWNLLRDLSETQPLVIGVDDIQYADVVSGQFLAYLARRTRDSRVFMVLTESTQALPPDRLLHTEVLCRSNCHCIALRGLSRRGVADLLQARLPGADRQLAGSCHRISGGNPLLAQALTEDYRASGGEAAHVMVPGAAFRRAVCVCLYRCDPVVVELARVLAVLETVPPAEILGELLDLGPETAEKAFRILTAVGILDGGRFRHEDTRKVVLDSMSADELAALHSRVARVLYLAGEAPVTLARHLLAANSTEASWAVPMLEDAAADALAAGQPEAAVGYLRRAYRESVDEKQRAAIKAALAGAEWCLAPANAARHLPELVIAAQRGLLDSRQVGDLVYHLLWHGSTEYAVTALQSVGDDEADPYRQELAALLRPWLGFFFPRLRGHLTHLSGEHAADTAPGGTPPGGSVPELLVSATGRNEEEILSVAERVLERQTLEDPSQAQVITALMALLCEDRVDRAAFWYDAFQRDAIALDIPLWSAIYAAFQAMIENRRGNVAAAEHHARTALTVLGPKGWGVAVGCPLAGAIFAATAARRLEDAAAYLRSPVPEAMFGTPFGLLYLHARGNYYLATDRLNAALDDFQSCGARMRAWALDLPAFVPWRTAAAQVCLRTGDTATARELAAEQLAMLRPWHVRTRGVSLRVLALTEHPAQRPLLLQQAAEALRESGDRLELAQVLADLSGTYAELGDGGRAQTLARQAEVLAGQCGADVLKDAPPVKADHGRPAAPSGLDPFGELSGAERRVAEFAARGYTNREIAGKLHVTVSTVEQHLTRVYRKLGVNSRADLPVDPSTDLAEP
ncbi:ATP-binding protein [Streptomyces sp. 7R007]